jgi:hypothetical protein
MAKKTGGIPKDVNQNAARIVALSTGQSAPDLSTVELKRLRSQAASILGKLGGSKGGKERAKRLTAEQRSDIAKRAASARWSDK